MSPSASPPATTRRGRDLVPARRAVPASRVRLDDVVLIGRDRRATFELDGRPVTVAEGGRLGAGDVIAIRADGVVLRTQMGLQTVQLGQRALVD